MDEDEEDGQAVLQSQALVEDAEEDTEHHPTHTAEERDNEVHAAAQKIQAVQRGRRVRRRKKRKDKAACWEKTVRTFTAHNAHKYHTASSLL